MAAQSGWVVGRELLIPRKCARETFARVHVEAAGRETANALATEWRKKTGFAPAVGTPDGTARGAVRL
jgi:hypothetical protein